MNLNYQLTDSDYLEFQLYTASRSEFYKKRRRNLRLIIPVLYILFSLYFYLIYQYLTVVLIFLIIAGVWFFLYPLYSRWLYKNHFKKYVKKYYKTRVGKPIEIEFNENSILAKDFTSESIIDVTKLTELVETKDHFFIKLATDTSLIIPKREISNQSEFKNKIAGYGVEYVNELDWAWK